MGVPWWKTYSKMRDFTPGYKATHLTGPQRAVLDGEDWLETLKVEVLQSPRKVSSPNIRKTAAT